MKNRLCRLHPLISWNVFAIVLQRNMGRIIPTIHYTSLLRSLERQLDRSGISSVHAATCQRIELPWELNESRASSSTISSRRSNCPISKTLRTSFRISFRGPCVHSRCFTIGYKDITLTQDRKNTSTCSQCTEVCESRQKTVSAVMQCCTQRSHSSWRTPSRIGDTFIILLSGRESTRTSVAQ